MNLCEEIFTEHVLNSEAGPGFSRGYSDNEHTVLYLRGSHTEDSYTWKQLTVTQDNELGTYHGWG